MRRSGRNFKVKVGDRYGRLTVVSPVLVDSKTRWSCRCDCGQDVIALGSNLRGGKHQSCGCLARERASARMRDRNTKHGLSGSPTWLSWRAMVSRCTNPNIHDWARYGGRGVLVCDRWRRSFKNFLADMGTRPNGTTIDRINTNGHYEPGNCRWATPTEQAANRRPNARGTPKHRRAQISWLVSVGMPRAEVANLYGLCLSQINNIFWEAYPHLKRARGRRG